MPETQTDQSRKLAFRKALAPFERPAMPKAVSQILTSHLPYAALWVAMAFSLQVSYWLTLLLAVFAAGFLVRIFIISHDCGHGSFFRSKRANDFVGFISAALAFIPYHYWTHEHAIHHATAGNLDRRGTGDVWTMTLPEYEQAPWHLKLRFRIVRNPLCIFLVGPLIMFVVFHRFARPDAGWRWHRSVLWSNLLIVGSAALIIAAIGWKAYVMIQLPVIFAAGVAGIWLFYVQHQFEDVYWDHNDQWDFFRAAMEGCSYYKLPAVLQWFSGNIGFHHIHHLSPRVPNYNLEDCHRKNPIFHTAPELTLRESFGCMRLRVWDPESRQAIPLGVF